MFSALGSKLSSIFTALSKQVHWCVYDLSTFVCRDSQKFVLIKSLEYHVNEYLVTTDSFDCDCNFFLILFRFGDLENRII